MRNLGVHSFQRLCNMIHWQIKTIVFDHNSIFNKSEFPRVFSYVVCDVANFYIRLRDNKLSLSEKKSRFLTNNSQFMISCLRKTLKNTPTKCYKVCSLYAHCRIFSFSYFEHNNLVWFQVEDKSTFMLLTWQIFLKCLI